MNSVLGLFVHGEKIKIVELCPSDKPSMYVPVSWGEIDLPPQSVRDGLIVSPRLVGEKITAYTKERNITAKQAIVLLNSNQATTRISRLPQNLNDAQIRLNLETEVCQYHAFCGTDNILDFKKTEEISEEGIKKVNVLFAATQRSLTESYLKTLEVANIDLIGVDVPILSLVRLLDGVDVKSDSLDVTLLILFCHKYVEMCVLKGNRPRFLHSVELSAMDFENNKEDFVERFVSAIRLVVSFYQERIIHGEQISRIIINPSCAVHTELPVLLASKMPQIQIQMTNSLAKMDIPADKPEIADQLRYQYSCLLGVILRIENKSAPYHLNLLAEQKLSLQTRFNQVYVLTASFVLLLGLMIFSLLAVLVKLAVVHRQIASVVLQLQKPSPELTKAMALKKHREIIGQQLHEATWISEQNKEGYFKAIARAGTLVPENLWLVDMRLDPNGESLNLSGQAKTEKPIFDYRMSLLASGAFGDVELVSSKSEGVVIFFILKCKFK
ncbi:MAG: pilus assembly protein PilM [Candidatus Omnitrophota bacterium]